MKITQTNDQLTIKNGAIFIRLFGAFMAAGGLTLMVVQAVGGGVAANPALVFGIGAAIIAVGLAMIFLTSTTVTVLDKTNPSAVTKKRLLGASKSEQFDASGATAVQLTVTRNINNNFSSGNGAGVRGRSTQQTSVLSLIFNDGSTVELGRDAHTLNAGGNIGLAMNMVRQAPLKKEADLIGEFLNLPVQVSSDNPADQVGNIIKAMTQGFSGQSEATPPIQPQATQQPANPAAAPAVPTPQQNAAAQTMVMPQQTQPQNPPQPQPTVEPQAAAPTTTIPPQTVATPPVVTAPEVQQPVQPQTFAPTNPQEPQNTPEQQ